MTLVPTQVGVMWPSSHLMHFNSNTGVGQITTVLDATGEQCAYVGRVLWNDRGTHTVGSSSVIHTHTWASTWANGASTFDVGIQDVATGAGPAAQPDGTFDVKGTFTGGDGSVVSVNFSAFPMTTGSKSIAQGDLIAVVFDFTNRAGSDSIQLNRLTTNTFLHTSLVNTNLGGAGWAAIGPGSCPNIIIVADDGAIGTFDFSTPGCYWGASTFKSGDAADEFALMFQLPWSGKIDALWAAFSYNSTTSDGTISLYTDPLGTPTVVSGASKSFLAETTMRASALTPVLSIFTLPSEVAVSHGVSYALGLKATGAGNLGLHTWQLSNANFRSILDGGTTLERRSRTGSAAFGSASTTFIPMMGVRYSSLHDAGGGGGGGLLVNPGMRGGMI